MAADLASLKPKVRVLVEALISNSQSAGCPILIIHTFRTIEEQDALYAKGRTAPGNIVTRAKGGSSLHNYGVAFDFAPMVEGRPNWKRLDLFDRVGVIGEGLGLEWGGRWVKFKDRPHFQLRLGYRLKDFQQGKVDESKFA